MKHPREVEYPLGRPPKGNVAERFPDEPGWMGTRSGRVIFPLRPKPGEIVIGDIAHALSNICRYGGHTVQFYSVAEHSVHVARAVGERSPAMGLEGLLHDATEAYLGDLIRPLKHLAGYGIDYRIAEAALHREIAEVFGLDGQVPPLIKEIENRILCNERVELLPKMKDPNFEWGLEAVGGDPLQGVTIECWSPPMAKAKFLALFHQLMGERERRGAPMRTPRREGK